VTIQTSNQVHHVAILVRSIDASVGFFRDHLNFPIVADEQMPEIGVRMMFLDAGPTLIQLVEPLAGSRMQLDLDRKGEGLHHICFSVPDLDLALSELSPGEPVNIYPTPRGRTAFLPTGPNGVRTELIEVAPPSLREGVS
jgi:methylmalonyl-CoA/ethylmalonyl-CoA epimerase